MNFSGDFVLWPFFLVTEGKGWVGCRSGCGHVFPSHAISIDGVWASMLLGFLF